MSDDHHVDPSSPSSAMDHHDSDPRAESSRSLHHDDDVFSDRSPRSSTGTPADDYDHHHHDIHDIHDHHDVHDDTTHDDHIDTSKAAHVDDDNDNGLHTVHPVRVAPTQRPFRPSVDVNRALAVSMSSPPPSIFSSPRSATKRASGMSQFSPKGRSTPSRFRARKESPALVLLHVTVLPLRWAWADVLDRAGDDDELTPALRGLREGWRQLQDRVGDNVLERGVLLAHPQDDYGLLEERLLEALELPLLRRARILECGHYVGPANEPESIATPRDDDYDDDDDHHHAPQHDPTSTTPIERDVHWCATCRHDIRLEALGPGKVFRVKVYASNGLIRAGAWSACWREMERVDVELEPITEGDVIAELERLAVDLHIDDEGLPERVRSRLSRSHTSLSHRHAPPKSPSPATTHPGGGGGGDSTTPKTDQERRMREDARMREIYGHTPPQHARRPQSSYISPSPSPSLRGRSRERGRNVSFGYPDNLDDHSNKASDAGTEGHGERRSKEPVAIPPRSTKRDMKNASLGKLVVEALRAFVNDSKSMAILFLVIVAGLLAIRGPPESGFFGLGGQHDEPLIVANVVVEHSPKARMEEAASEKDVARLGDLGAMYIDDDDQEETGLALLNPAEMIAKEGGEERSDDTDESIDDPIIEEVLSQTHTLAESQTRTRTQTKVQVAIETQTVTEIAKETVRVVHTVTETQITTETAAASHGFGLALQRGKASSGSGSGVGFSGRYQKYQHYHEDQEWVDYDDEGEAETMATLGESRPDDVFGALQRDPCEPCRARRFA